MVGTILGMLGHQVSDEALKEIIDEVDEDGQYFFVYQFFSLCFTLILIILSSGRFININSSLDHIYVIIDTINRSIYFYYLFTYWVRAHLLIRSKYSGAMPRKIVISFSSQLHNIVRLKFVT